MIELSNIHKSLSDKEVIKGIDLSIKKGEVIILVGRSGSGKTTLLRMVNALEIPIEGNVTVNDKTYTAKDKKSQIEIRRQSGMVFRGYNSFPHKTALENVMEGLVTAEKMGKSEVKDGTLDLLEKIGLTCVKDQRPHTLSGGQQQRVAITRALAMNPKVILFDEPTFALGPELVSNMLKVIKELADEGMTTVIATHVMRFTKEVSNKVVFIHDDEIGEEGSPEELFDHPKTDELKRFLSATNEN